ncbi:MAG: poly(A) polymerase [Methyloligella sp.]|nr:MAG: poly(A) polymerase [Methyloligella sp.]
MTKIIENKLADAKWLETKELKKLFETFLVKGDELKVVGGAPRNHLLGKPVEDVDLATIFTPDEIVSKAKLAGIKTIPTGIEHGTVTVLINDTTFEITTLRADVKTDGRHATVEFGTSWLEDAKRRDFTINALYVLADGTVEDPLGTGLADIKTQTVRFIGNAENRIREDNLRSLRYYRFASHYTKPPFDPQAISATIKLKEGLRSLSAERIKSELFKILSAPEPVEVVTELYQNGLLAALLGTAPNIRDFFKLVELEKKLNENADTSLRLAILTTWHVGDVERLTKRFKLSKTETKKIELKVKADLEKNSLVTSLDLTKSEGRFLYNKYLFILGKADYSSLIKLLYALGHCSLNLDAVIEKIKSIEADEVKELPVKGADIIKKGVPPGPEVGKILEHLTMEWLKSDGEASSEELLALIKS